MKIAICDDERKWIFEIEKYLEKLQLEYADIEWDAFNSGEELLEKYSEDDNAYDIVIIDIELGNTSGIDVAVDIRKKDRNCIIIFLTGFNKYMKMCFSSMPLAFWEKPLSYEEFSRDIKNAINILLTHKRFFVFKFNRREYMIPYNKILYLNSDKRMICVVTAEEKYEFYGSLKDYEDELIENNFVFTHKSYCVNMAAILSRTTRTVLLTNGVEISVSNSHRQSYEKAYLKYIIRESGV